MNPLEARRRLLGRNVYKRTTEGNPAIAQGSLARMHPGITMQGWTEQDSTTGAQLFDKTKIEDRADTTHTETDTGVEVSGLYYVVHRVSVTPNTDMYISYNKSGEGLNQVSVYGTDTSADNFISSSYGKGMKFNTGNHTEILVLFYSSTGTENVSIYNDVMLNLGATALPYEPYTGDKPSPSPEYPQPITSAGKYNEDTQKWEYEITIANEQTDPDKNQTVALTSDRPLTKWDKLEKRNGQWGWVYKSAEIKPYTDESVPGEYFSTTGQLSTGAQVWYETATETFVPLTTAEQEAMNALYTFRPTTVLSNDCGCSMSLTYKTKKSMGEGNLLDYRKLINLDKWSPVGSDYRHFDISLKPNTTYKLSVSVNNMYLDYKKDYNDRFAFYTGETPDTSTNNVLFGNTNVDTVLTEHTFATSENPFYLNLYVFPWNSENLHIVFDELLPNIKLEEVTT